MIIGIASDHRGYKLKEKLKKYFNKKNIEFVDFGTDSNVSVDYNDYASLVCEAVIKGEVTYGILICYTGIGMSIMANKFKGIRCAKIDNAMEARLAKEHNNANVLSFSSFVLYLEAKDMIDSFLNASFLEGNHLRRVNKIIDRENDILLNNKENIKKHHSEKKKNEDNE